MAIGPLARVLPWQNKSAEQHRDRQYGAHLGFVRDRNDPQKAGRVRVYVPSMFGDDTGEEAWLDWCIPSSPGLNVPPPGAPVIVFFEQGYPSHGVYLHGWLTGEGPSDSAAPVAGKEQLDPTWVQEKTGSSAGGGPTVAITIPKDDAIDNLPKYPWNKVYETPDGMIIEVDDTPDRPRARVHHPKGASFLIKEDGSMDVRCKGISWFADGDFNVLLGKGASFKVVYPGGSGFAVGGMGTHITGHQASILGRAVKRAVEAI